MAIDFNAKDEEPDLRSELECFPNIDPGIEILGDRVLVQLRREKTASKGGILLVDETRQTLRFNETVAKVVQVGPLAYRNLEDLTPWIEGPWCKEGDFVLLRAYSGSRFSVDGKEFIIVNDDMIEGVVEDPRGRSSGASRRRRPPRRRPPPRRSRWDRRRP